MPDLDCLNGEIAGLKKGQETQATQILKLTYDVAENTKMTQENTRVTLDTKSDTTEIVELMKWGRTTRAILFWVSSTIAALWALVEVWGKFKQ
jgi:hypothetical protein